MGAPAEFPSRPFQGACAQQVLVAHAGAQLRAVDLQRMAAYIAKYVLGNSNLIAVIGLATVIPMVIGLPFAGRSWPGSANATPRWPAWCSSPSQSAGVRRSEQPVGVLRLHHRAHGRHHPDERRAQRHERRRGGIWRMAQRRAVRWHRVQLVQLLHEGGHGRFLGRHRVDTRCQRI